MIKRSTAVGGLIILLCAGLATWLLAGMNGKDAGRERGGRRPPTVEVAPVRQADVPLILQSTGQVTPVQQLEVRPQVSGVVARILVREGQMVSAGNVLFELEAAAERAGLAEARARLQRDRAALEEARRTLDSNRRLQKQGFVAEQVVDNSLSAVKGLEGTVAAGEASIRAAETALGYRTIRAAISGRAGLVNVYPGSVVSLSMATPMVTLTPLDPVTVSFTVPERELPRIVAAWQAGPVAVQARLPGQQREWQGRLSFVDSQVDARSGTLRLKAEFSNRDQALWPGVYVNLTLQAGVERNALVIPQPALQTGPDGQFAFVLQDSKVRAVPVEVVDIRDQQVIVRGLQPGTAVVVRGGVNVRPGDEVSVAGKRGAPSAREPR